MTRSLATFLTFGLVLHCVAFSQHVVEVVRLPGGYTQTNGYPVHGSMVRASKHGVTVCSKPAAPNNNSFIYYLTERGSSGQIMLRGRPVKQAVIVDTQLFVTMYLTRRIDSLHASMSLDGSNWKYYPSGGDRGYEGEQISLFAGMIAGFNYGGGPYTIDTVTHTSKQRYADWSPQLYATYEPIAMRDGSMFGLSFGVVRWTNDAQKKISGPSFPGSLRFTATEIGDSVYCADESGPTALSLVDGGIQMHKYPNRNWANGSRYGIAGAYGQLYTIYSSNNENDRRFYYFSNGNNDPLLIELPDVSDTTSQILGGAWWNGSFYIATYIGRSDETVLYAIKEPAPTVSVQDCTPEHQQVTTQRIYLTRNQVQEWFASLSRSGWVQVFDVLGRPTEPKALCDGIVFVVAKGKMWTVMVSGE